MKTTLYIKVFVCLFCIVLVNKTFAQNVGITASGSFTPDASAGLDVSFTNKGLLIPRVALTATNAAGPITTPATSLLVYNTATAGTSPNNVVPGYYYWNGAAWSMLSTSTQTNANWSTTGNAGTTAGTNFIGTTDAKDFVFKTNNTEAARFTSGGSLTIGNNTTPDATNPEKLFVDAGTTTSFNGLVVKGSIDNYFQMNVKNQSTGATATSDIVATANNGTETSNYVDLGINGSGYTGSNIQTGKANDGYLISAGNDFYLVNSTPNKSMLFLTGGTGVAQERMRILSNGRVGMGVQDPTSQFVVKDTMEIRRTGPLSQLLFTNTSGSGDLRIAGDGGDLFWQGGGSRALQMGSFWTTILGGDRQTTTYPAYVSSLGGTGVLVQSQRNASVPLGVQAFSGSQSANLTEWRNSAGTVLSAITKDGNLGIGTNTPATKLHVFGANPLTLSGVVTGTSTSADSLLTITNGLVRKLPISGFASPASWSTTGNAGTTAGTNFIGTTDAVDFVIKTGGTERARFTNTGDVSIGGTAFNSTNPEQLLVDAGTTSSYNVINGKGSINNYLQLNIQNTNAGTAASSDVVATADNGSETANYIDMGINSSGNTAAFFGGINDAYLYNTGGTAAGGNLFIGTSTSGKALGFMTGGGATTNERMRIDGNGNVGIGTTTPAQKLDVRGTIVSSATTYPNYAYNTANRMAFGETVVPGNETGSVVQYGSGSGTRNMVFAFSKTTINTSFLGNDGTQTMLGSEGTSNPITFKTGLAYNAANIIGSGTEVMRITAGGNVGIGTTGPTATLHLKAGTATANTSPLKFTSGTLLTTAETGAVEFDGTNYFATSGTVRYTLAKTLTATQTLDFPSTLANTSSNLTITVTGAADGDVVSVGAPNGSVVANSSYTAYVSAANTVTVKFVNSSTAAIDPASGTFRVSVLKY